MIGLITYTSPHKIPIPIGDTGGAATIAGWLSSDIQYTIGTVGRWERIINDVGGGSKQCGYQGTGNAFSVSVSRTLCLLVNEFVEHQRVCMTLDQVLSVLDNYRKFLESDYRNDPRAAQPFSVEYVAEGEDAVERFSQNS